MMDQTIMKIKLTPADIETLGALLMSECNEIVTLVEYGKRPHDLCLTRLNFDGFYAFFRTNIDRNFRQIDVIEGSVRFTFMVYEDDEL